MIGGLRRTAAAIRRIIERSTSLDLSELASLPLPVVDLPAGSTLDGEAIASTGDIPSPYTDADAVAALEASEGDLTLDNKIVFLGAPTVSAGVWIVDPAPGGAVFPLNEWPGLVVEGGVVADAIANVEYTDADAVAAVEGAASLDLPAGTTLDGAAIGRGLGLATETRERLIGGFRLVPAVAVVGFGCQSGTLTPLGTPTFAYGLDGGPVVTWQRTSGTGMCGAYGTTKGLYPATSGDRVEVRYRASIRAASVGAIVFVGASSDTSAATGVADTLPDNVSASVVGFTYAPAESSLVRFMVGGGGGSGFVDTGVPWSAIEDEDVVFIHTLSNVSVAWRIETAAGVVLGSGVSSGDAPWAELAPCVSTYGTVGTTFGLDFRGVDVVALGTAP